MIRVLVADDEALIRDSFRMLLEPEPDIEWVGEAADGREAVARVRELRPDLVLMDVRMPVMDGLAATHALAAAGLETRVLVLTTYDSDQYLYDAMRAGAGGFCLKDMRREELMHAIRTVAGGEALLHPTLTKRLLVQFVKSPPPGVPAAEHPGSLPTGDRGLDPCRAGPVEQRDCRSRCTWARPRSRLTLPA